MVCDGGRLRAMLAAAAATPPAIPPAVAVWTMEGGAPRGGTAGWGRRGAATPPAAAAAAGLGEIWLPGGDAPAHIRMRVSGACQVRVVRAVRVSWNARGEHELVAEPPSLVGVPMAVPRRGRAAGSPVTGGRPSIDPDLARPPSLLAVSTPTMLRRLLRSGCVAG